jgi:hypothetical protein
MTPISDEASPVLTEIETTLRGWLTAQGWTIDEQDQADMLWAFGAQDRHGKRISFFQPRFSEDEFVVHSAVSYSDSDRARVEAHPPRVRQQLLWDIRFRLLDMEMRFEGADIPLQLISMSRTVSMDGLTKKEFWQEVSRVYRAILGVQWLFQRHLGEPAADDTLPVM